MQPDDRPLDLLGNIFGHQERAATECQNAALSTVNLARLEVEDTGEIRHLLDACQNDGFFYLDLATENGAVLLHDCALMLRLMEAYFRRPISAKMEDCVGSDTHGYKPVGTSAGVGAGHRDSYEAFKVSRTRLEGRVCEMSNEQFPDLLERFASACHRLTELLLSCLSNALGLPASERFELYHSNDERSTTFLGMLHYPPQTFGRDAGGGHNKHTDIGTLTILLAQTPGLQVLTPHGWRFVRPRPGHAVINVGDSLRFLSHGLLKSCVHRVIRPPDLRGRSRYSVCYFLRPRSDVELRTGDGRLLSARQWHDHKYEVFRQTHFEQDAGLTLTGGMERDNALVV